MRRLALPIAAAIFAASTTLASAAIEWSADFGPGRNATQPGKVVITDMGNSVKVTLDMQAGPAGADTPQPAHIHEGACPGVGKVAFPLTNVVNGKSETTVNTTFANLLSKQHSINVHKSAAEAGVYTACVDLPMGTVLQFKAGRDATQPGTAILEGTGNQTEVTLIMEDGPAGAATPQPAHIHVGTCPGVGKVAFPLTNVVNGESRTVVNASLATIMASQHSINVHKSAAEAGVYTACADIPLAQQAVAPAAPAPAAAAPVQLPRTGGAPVALLAILGGSFLAVGATLRRR